MTLPEQALTEAYEKYSAMLYHLALAQLQNREEAEDAVQEVFCRFFTGAPKFSDESHEKAWFLRVTVNQCRDQQRRSRHRAYVPLEEAPDLAAQTGLTDDSALDVLHILSLLPDKYRITVTLHYLEGFFVEEIASILQLGRSAVKMRLARARSLLQEKLGEEDRHV